VTQFVLIERWVDSHSLPAIVLRQIDVGDAFLREAAVQLFGDWQECRLVTDVGDGCEALVDDVWEAMERGDAIEETNLLLLLRMVVASRMRFVLWHGGDCSSLPIARSWRELVELLRSQARGQPADVWLRYEPADGASTMGCA
jgi:hypothetical protein